MDNKNDLAVYSWFEKCGIISHIRTQLRQNLINTLQKKNPPFVKGINKPKCAKQYLYDLLIAEYLFNVNYSYTLSVFASEAPLLVNIHNFSQECSDNGQTSNSHKLQTDYVVHTLESVGINVNDPKGQYILTEYANSTLPLLLCILKSVTFNEKAHDTAEVNKYLCNKYVQTNPVKKSNTSDMVLMKAKKKLLHQKQVFDSHLKEREIVLKEQIITMEHQLTSLNEKLKQMQHLMYVITSKEKQINEKKHNDRQCIFQKEMELCFKENLLSQEANRLRKEQDYYKKFECNLSKLQELVEVRKEVPNKGPSISVKDVETQTSCDSHTAKSNEIRILNKEKQELHNLVQEQQSRIEQLTLRAVRLSRQLEELHLLKSTTVQVPLPDIQVTKPNTLISDSSSTEDILLDAKMRLKRLEEENIKANKYYYNCIATSP